MLTRDTDRGETLKRLGYMLFAGAGHALARDCVRQLSKVPQTEEQRDARGLYALTAVAPLLRR